MYGEDSEIRINRDRIAEKMRDIRRIHELDGNPMATDDAGFLVQLLDRYHKRLLDDLGIGDGETTAMNASAAEGADGESGSARLAREAFGNSRKDVALYGGDRLSRGESVNRALDAKQGDAAGIAAMFGNTPEEVERCNS